MEGLQPEGARGGRERATTPHPWGILAPLEVACGASCGVASISSTCSAIFLRWYWIRRYLVPSGISTMYDLSSILRTSMAFSKSGKWSWSVLFLLHRLSWASGDLLRCDYSNVLVSPIFSGLVLLFFCIGHLRAWKSFFGWKKRFGSSAHCVGVFIWSRRAI